MTARPLLVVIAAAVVVAAVALAFAGVKWFGGAATIEWQGDRFVAAGGTASARDGVLTIESADSNGAFIAVMPNAQLDARDYTAIEVVTRGLPEQQPIALFWRSRASGQRTFTHRADVVSARGVRAELDRDPNWSGAISGVGVIVAGAPPRGASLVTVRAIGASAATTAREAVSAWFRVEPWNNQSINVVFLGGQYHAFPFTLFVGIVTLVALTAWIVWYRRRDVRVTIVGAAVIVAVGWLALDLRWLVNFARVETLSLRTLAGKTLDEKRLAAQDGPLFAFVEKARERIEKQPGRVFFGSDDAWLRARGGYHLLPFNAVSLVYHRGLFEPYRYRPGDWLCFYSRSGVTYDQALRVLRWDGGPPLKAERVLAVDGGELYRVIS